MLDTSAALGALVGLPRDPELAGRLAGDGDLHAPHLIDIELLHALRRLVAGETLSEARAAEARTDFAELPIVRYAHVGLVDRIWELRANLTPYDAAFVALAELTEAPLVTCDARLAAAPGHGAEIELYGHRVSS